MKTHLGAQNCLYPMPTVLVGTHVNGKPNFITIAHVGIMDHQTVSLGMNKVHYSNAGIKENGAFSINIPSVDMVRLTDYCGIASGKREDKAALFEIFYGQVAAAPLIQACPVNMACRLVQTVDFPKHDIFIGEIVDTYGDDRCLTDGVLDLAKVQPFLFDMMQRSYWRLGEKLGRAWNIGKDYKKD
jgi:flavin reductase (DIM6/NTAB) family NADH-FMN oxidoreductase RutF